MKESDSNLPSGYEHPRISRIEDFSVLIARTELENCAEEAAIRRLPISLELKEALDSLKELRATIDGLEILSEDIQNGQIRRSTGLVGRGASFGMEALTFLTVVGGISASVHLGERLLTLVRWIKSKLNRKCILSQSALKIYILQRLREIFPDDLLENQPARIELMNLTASDEDHLFGYLDHYVFVAHGFGACFTGIVDHSGDLVNSQITVARPSFQVSTISGLDSRF